jgi:hypothetical protein
MKGGRVETAEERKKAIWCKKGAIPKKRRIERHAPDPDLNSEAGSCPSYLLFSTHFPLLSGELRRTLPIGCPVLLDFPLLYLSFTTLLPFLLPGRIRNCLFSFLSLNLYYLFCKFTYFLLQKIRNQDKKYSGEKHISHNVTKSRKFKD